MTAAEVTVQWVLEEGLGVSVRGMMWLDAKHRGVKKLTCKRVDGWLHSSH